MTERLIVDDDEAYTLARDLAERRGVSVEEAVVSSLRASLEAVEPPAPSQTAQTAPFRIPTLEELTPRQREIYERLGALAAETAAQKRPGATSDHRDMYDDRGLPK